MNRIHAAITTIASVPAALGLVLPAPISTASPDLGHAVCDAIGKEGANLRGFLTINAALQQKGVRNPDAVIHQSVASDCPQYNAALAESDRESGTWVRANGPNGGPGYGQCPNGGYYQPLKGDCEAFPP